MGNTTISYDGGNPTNWYNGSKTYTGLTWTNGRQLTSVTVGSKTATYAYDADGIRTQKTVDGVTHTYYTLNGKLMRESFPYSDTTIIMDFIYDESGKPFAVCYSKDGGAKFTPYFYATNLQGDVEGIFRVLKNGTTGLYEQKWYGRYTYDAWGNVTAYTAAGNSPGSTTLVYRNPIRYRGYVYDTETGFYYLQSRYYDPANHRFINADSYASTDSTDAISCNMFAYCGNNPVMFEDQDGELGLIVASLILAGLGAIIDYGVQVVSNYQDGYTGKEAWVDEVSFGSVVSTAFSSSIALSTFGVGSAIADFLLSPAIELSVDHAISPEKNDPLTLKNYAIKQMKRFGDICITEEISNAISESYQNPLTDDVIQSTVKGMVKSNTIDTIWSAIKNFIITISK